MHAHMPVCMHACSMLIWCCALATAPGAWAAEQLDKELLAAEVRPAVTEAIRLQADVETRVLLANLKVCSRVTSIPSASAEENAAADQVSQTVPCTTGAGDGRC